MIGISSDKMTFDLHPAYISHMQKNYAKAVASRVQTWGSFKSSSERVSTALRKICSTNFFSSSSVKSSLSIWINHGFRSLTTPTILRSRTFNTADDTSRSRFVCQVRRRSMPAGQQILHETNFKATATTIQKIQKAYTCMA